MGVALGSCHVAPFQKLHTLARVKMQKSELNFNCPPVVGGMLLRSGSTARARRRRGACALRGSAAVE